MALDIETLVIILGALVLVLSISVVHLEFKLRNFTKGQNGVNLEQVILKAHKDIEHLTHSKSQIEEYLKDVERRLRRSIQGVETIRFNPFRGTGDGGNQSFATALLSEDGNGVVLSSLYSRDRMSIFAKPIKKHRSEHELSQEEKEALENAKLKA